MRPIEMILPILLALYLIWRQPRPLIIRVIPFAALVLVPIHLGSEGYRWQMIPLYVLTGVLALSALARIRSSDWRPFASFLMLILLLAASALPILLPVPSIPAPSGPYSVGMRSYELTDSRRPELYSGKVESRRFQVQIWYPAQVSPSDRRAPWMADADIFTPAIAAYIDMPSFFLDHLALVKLPAYPAAQVAPNGERFPLILFSHGWNGFSAQNTGQALELASHGYVVIGVQHTYGAVVTAFADGSIARNNPSALPAGAPDDEYEAAAQKLVDQWAGDLASALDFMQGQNEQPTSPFYRSLDLSRVGVYGHSTGGGAAIQFCGTDARCRALLGMDPFMRPVSRQVLEKGGAQPSFFMFSQRWADDVNSRNNQLFDSFQSNGHQVMGVISIAGTEHYDFSDLPLLSPLAARLGLKGPIGGSRVTTIINDYLLDFFDFTLQEGTGSLFEGQPQKYDEVRFQP